MKKVPLRMCIVCREMHPKKSLVRIVSSKEDGVSVDTTGRKSGKGAYLCRSAGCIGKAQKTSALKRAFEKEIPQEVYEELEKYAK